LRPWSARSEGLIDLLCSTSDGIHLSEHVDRVHGPAIYQAACRMGLEGIVSKRVDRPYRPGASRGLGQDQEPDAPAAAWAIKG
jgi:bifunctional non-homologous end joining protein LigD